MSDKVLNNIPRELLADLLSLDREKRIPAERHLYALLSEPAQASAAQSAHDEVFAIPVRENGKRTTLYTEVLPFVPGPGVEVLGEPVRMVAAQSAPAGEREAFEAWLSSLKFVSGQGQAHIEYCLHRDLSDKYTTEWVSYMYRGWQARASWQRTQSAGVLPPFAIKVIEKLQRFFDCAEDFESGGVDIGRDWLDTLTHLGLLERVQRSPALWQITEDGDALLSAAPAQPAALAYKDDPRSAAELSLLGCRCVRFGEGNPHWPCKIHRAAHDQGEMQRLREALDKIVACNWTSSETATDFAISQTKGNMIRQMKDIARKALAASTGQEVKP